jgi:hypothetical protein
LPDRLDCCIVQQRNRAENPYLAHDTIRRNHCFENDGTFDMSGARERWVRRGHVLKTLGPNDRAANADRLTL